MLHASGEQMTFDWIRVRRPSHQRQRQCPRPHYHNLFLAAHTSCCARAADWRVLTGRGGGRS